MRAAIVRDACRPAYAGADVESQDGIVRGIQRTLAGREFKVEAFGCGRDIGDFLKRLAAFKPGIVLNLCESVFGDPGKEPLMPAVLRSARFKFTGSDSGALMLAGDKLASKAVLRQQKIPVPDFMEISPGSTFPNSVFLPAIIKPRFEHASVGIDESVLFLEDREELLLKAGLMARELNQPVIAEKFIEGREISLSLIGEKTREVLPPAEIEFSGGAKILSYRAKWAPGSPEYENTVSCCPARLEERLLEKISDLARRAALSHSCTGYARVDFRVDAELNPFIIDINPNPDLGEDSGFARSAKAAGIPYGELLEKIITLGHKRQL